MCMGGLTDVSAKAYRWDPSFRLENTKSPHPENPREILKKYNFAPHGQKQKKY